MRISGQKVESKNRIVVALPRSDGPPLTFTVSPPPLGEESRFERLFPIPLAPERFKMSGKLIVRDPDTNRPVIERLTDDPEWSAHSRLQTTRRLMQQFRTVLDGDANVEFDADRVPGRPSSDDRDAWERYADALYREIQEAGLTRGEVFEIAQAGFELGSPSAETIKTARDAFLSKRPQEGSQNLLLTEPAGTPDT